MEDARNKRRFLETDGNGRPIGMIPIATAHCLGCGELWKSVDINGETRTYQLIRPDPKSGKHDHRFEVVEGD
jgi:hypothetical protein